jgi:hypothetical protein
MVHEPDPNSPLGQAQARARQVPAWIRLPVIAAVFIATGYCVFANAGPYRFLAEAQAKLFDGKHYLMLSGGLTLLLFLVPAVVVMQLLGAAFAKPHAGAPPQGPPQGPPGPY